MEKNKTSKESVLATWIFIIILAVYFLIYSLSAFVLIGDQGPPVLEFRHRQRCSWGVSRGHL